MNVIEYIRHRSESTYGKRIRILDNYTHRSLGPWTCNADRDIMDIKVTEKIIFIFVK